MITMQHFVRMWPEWINEDGRHLTCYDIAVSAKCDLFMGRRRNYMCYRAQQQRWTGDIRSKALRVSSSRVAHVYV
jgi:hypothetical protein